jgi:polyisoprenoid-binding protein YceI
MKVSWLSIPFVGCCLIILVGCANLIRPNYTQDLVSLRAGNYTLDRQHAFVNFKINHLGLSTMVGRFNRVDASLQFDPANIAAMQINGIIEAASVDINNQDLEDTLRGIYWFDTDRYPQITFESSSVSPLPTDELELTGSLTIKGVSQQVTLLGRFNGGADNLITGKYTLGFSATASISRAAFGIDAFDSVIADNVDIEIHAEFQRNN